MGRNKQALKANVNNFESMENQLLLVMEICLATLLYLIDAPIGHTAGEVHVAGNCQHVNNQALSCF